VLPELPEWLVLPIDLSRLPNLALANLLRWATFFSVVKRVSIVAVIAFWLLAVGYGLNALMIYKGMPGASGSVPDAWPQNELFTPSFKKPQLVMFAHPRCPCTRASLQELELAAARAPGDFDAAVVFYEPEKETAAWSQTDSIRLARSIPGVRVILDTEGRLARRFGVETSGHTVVFGTNGRLSFSGGITGARGHMGDNAGLDSVLKMVGNGSAP